MSSVKIFWDPEGREVDFIGKKDFIDRTDGDTPRISMSVRMLSIDAPEVHYPSNQKPSKQDANLLQLAQRIDQGKASINSDLGKYLYPKLATGKAGSLQEAQGNNASEAFQKLLDEKLRTSAGKKRKLFIYAADQHFDQYGRLLAYLAPNYSPEEMAIMSRKDRATFNLLLVESGWAAPFPIYPSIPRLVDLVLLQRGGREAYEAKRGIWEDPLTLTGYEFRMSVRLYEITAKSLGQKKRTVSKEEDWVSRYCVDMTTREVFFPQDYFKVPPYNRIFVWPADIAEAVGRMNLLPTSATL